MSIRYDENTKARAFRWRGAQWNGLCGPTATIHHSDAGSQYTATHYSETPVIEGLIPPIGTIGDALSTTLDSTPKSTPVTRTLDMAR
jgi:hypothetical protein